MQEARIKTAQLERFLSKQPPSRVIVESASGAFRIAELAQSFGHDVRVVPATLARQLGVGQRGLKTDIRDARVLSEVSSRVELCGVHIPSAVSQERKALCSSREGLVKSRTQLINCVRGHLRGQGIVLRAMATERFADRVREQLLCHCQGLPLYMDALLQSIQTLSEQIAVLDREVTEIAKADPVCQRLMTVPGVGPVTALRFYSAVDEVSRFANAADVGAYFGLTPGEHSSGEKKRRTHISKAGSAAVRRTLVQAAWCAIRTRPDEPMVQWALRIAERRGNPIAVVALARKLAGILYALCKSSQDYDPKHASTQPTHRAEAA